MTSEIVLYQPDDTIQLEVRLQDETVWLSQQQMAELFGTDRTSILRHIHNVYKTHELEELATCAKIAQVRLEGNRQVMLSGSLRTRYWTSIRISRHMHIVTGIR